MVQVNEVTSQKHIQLYFLEFLEAMSRIADAADILPQNFISENKDSKSEVTIRLHHKIEGLIQHMYLNLPISQLITDKQQANAVQRLFEKVGVQNNDLQTKNASGEEDMSDFSF